jgi:hypothetical protein
LVLTSRLVWAFRALFHRLRGLHPDLRLDDALRAVLLMEPR